MRGQQHTCAVCRADYQCADLTCISHGTFAVCLACQRAVGLIPDPDEPAEEPDRA